MEIKQELAQVQKRPDDAAPVECHTSPVAALREALEACIEAMCRYCRMEAGRDRVCVNGCETLKMAKAALAAPARNCDVGTVEEQSERIYAYCKAHRDDDAECLYCPLFGRTGGYCELVWAQMPYEKEGGAK